MSQYPSPYSPPNPQYPQPTGYGYPPGAFPDPRAPARRAGILMITLGSIGLLCGICASASLLMNNDAMMAQQPPELRSLMQQSMSTGAKAIVVAFAAVSLLELVLGIFTVRGSKAGAIGGIVLGGLGTLYFILNGLSGLMIGNAIGIVVLGISLVIVGVFVLQLLWAIAATRASSSVVQANAAYQAQYWQYMQQQQMYQQAYNQNPYNAPPAAGQPPPQQGYQWAPPPPGTPPSQTPAPPLPPPPTDGGPHGQGPQ